MLQGIFNALQSVEGHPLVGFVGDISRTWYRDHWMLMEVMNILRDANPNVVIVNGGQIPFDGYVEDMAERLNIDTLTYGSELPRMERLAAVYERPLEMLNGLEALLVFHRLDEPWQGLGQVVPAAINAGILVVSIDREGRSEQWQSVPTPRKQARS